MYQKDALEPFALSDLLGCLFELHAWDAVTTDKKTGQKNSGAGKTPLKLGWRNNDEISQDLIMSHIRVGGNLGFRIPTNMIVIDMDPRNYASGVGPEQVQENVAELLGFDTWEDLEWDCNLARTGGGGYHIYCQLPDNTIYKRIRSTIKGLKGVDIKKHGGYVVAPGSRHPNGDYYKWLSPLDADEDFGNVPVLGDKQLKIMLKPERIASDDASDMYGKLSADDLVNGFLSLVPATVFQGNDAWLPIMMACNHVTAGDGDAMDAFIEWSCSDPQYSDHGDKIQRRWESVGDDYDGDPCSIGTLLKALHDNSCEMGPLRKISDIHVFETIEDEFEDLEVMKDEEFDEHITDEEHIAYVTEKNELTRKLDLQQSVDSAISTMVESNTDDDWNQDEGFTPLSYVMSLGDEVSDEEHKRASRLIEKHKGALSSARALKLLCEKSGISQGVHKGLVKEDSEGQLKHIATNIRNTILKEVFNGGRHLTLADDTLYNFNGVYWSEWSDFYVKQIIERALTKFENATGMDLDRVRVINDCLTMLKIAVACEEGNKLMKRTARPIINCLDCELFIKNDGSVVPRPNRYQSYQLNVLPIEYGDQPADTNYELMCPLFMKTIRSTFSKFKDGEDVVRHVAEIFGYMLQPDKNLTHVWLFKGPGGDGKTVLLNILSALLGKAMYRAKQSLLKGENSHAEAALVGKLCIGIEEMKTEGMLNDETIKMYCDSKQMEANPKGRDEFTFDYTAGVLMCSNTWPKFTEAADSMTDRLRVVPFNMQFRKYGKGDPNITKKIVTNSREMGGVLRWALAGLQRLRARGHFQDPQSCVQWRSEWFEASNNTLRYIAECLDVVQGDDVGKVKTCAKSIYEHYQSWYENGNDGTRSRLGRNNFYEKLKTRGFVFKKTKDDGHSLKILDVRIKEDCQFSDFDKF